MSANTLSSSRVAAALEHCRRVTRARARNFYYGLKLLPEPQRSATYAVYAWMRMADDLVDALPAKSSAKEVEAFRSQTEQAMAGRVTDGDDPLWVALADTAARFDLRTDDFNHMLDGQLEDLTHQRYETFEQLRHYCYCVASTVGLVCIDIWGYDNAAARELAIDRGIAFQLTNILRDYRQDFDQGRVYLPAQEFVAAGITPEALREWKDPLLCESFLKGQLERAEGFYRRSAGLDAMITPQCRPTLWAMTTIYHRLLQKMARQPQFVITSRRVRLSAWQKGLIALRASVRARDRSSSRSTGLQATSPVTAAASTSRVTRHGRS